MNAPWSIQLFGGLRIQQSERLITRFRTQKTGALLAYLAYHRQHSQARDVLIEMFWPDTAPESGRHNLSHALSSLRHQLEPPGVPAGTVIIADRFSVELNPEAFTTDVADFEHALRLATQARNTPEQKPLLMQALEKYKGSLLPDYYEDWIAPEQERLAQRFQQAATQAMALLEKAGELEIALNLAQRAVSLDPLREEANRELIRLLTVTGQREAALRQYREYARALDQVLGEEPGRALRQMALQLEAEAPQSRSPQYLSPVAAMASPLPSTLVLPALPTGTVTFLMTDIEGSTTLWEKAGDAFHSALSSHHALLRREFRRHGGQEMKEAGDSFLVVFGSVGDALACAIACQRSLDAQPWPDETGTLRVRMALHTGDVELEAGEYHGLMLHCVARMLSAAHGGQTLCSEATAGLLKRDLDPQVLLKDLGVWRLRDVEEPERLFQAVYPKMALQEFPPLNASPAHRAHLPLQFTRFFGREAEIARIVEILTSPQTRLLTLTGPGGTGKTRLCLEAAGRFSETFAGAIWFVPLADLSDPGLIPQTILQALNLPLTGSQEPLEQLVAALTNHSTVLLLDNFEQLIAGGAERVQSLLSRVPTLQCLVTSRQTLGLPGEEEFAVAPLPTPNGSDTPERLSVFESVRLFVDRAQNAKPDFRITNSNAPAVAELCDRLEGMPLAIELAAARALVLTPSQMLVQLGSRFEFLVSRKRGIAERQRTLRATMDWSYRLLASDLQRFFARLCMFRGGWTPEAAEAVCEEPLALDMLAQLRECSLVSTQESESGIRFRMLESLREYGSEQMTAEERTHVERRRAEYFLALVEEAEPHLSGPRQVVWLDRLEADHDNLRAALKWCQEVADDTETGLRLAGSLWRFWDTRGYLSEGWNHLHAALSKKGVVGRTSARAKALEGAGRAAYYQNVYGHAQSLFNESLTICRELEDKRGIAYSLTNLGIIAKELGDYAQARILQEESLVIWRETEEKEGIAFALFNLGIVAVLQGENASARSRQEESLAMYRALGDKKGIALTLYNLGEILGTQGDDESAVRLCEESLTTFQELGYKAGIGFSYHYLGVLAEYRGDYPMARLLYTECLPLWRELGIKSQIAWALHGLGFVACQQGDYVAARTFLKDCLVAFRKIRYTSGMVRTLERFAGLAVAQRQMAPAGQLLAASENLREAMGAPLSLVEQPERNRNIDAIRTVLDDDEFAAAWAEGHAMTLDQAIAYALEGNGE